MHFENYCIPRRIKVKETDGKRKTTYRRIEDFEIERGEVFSLWEFNMESFSLFGLGIGQYFVQLLFFSALLILGSLILIPNMLIFYNEYKHGSGESFIELVSASCDKPSIVNATIGCDEGISFCPVHHRFNCPLSQTIAITDLIFSIYMVIGIFIVMQFEGRMVEKLDEAVQSPQDYSVVVGNPPADATNADEWFAFFSKFGNVK